MRPMRDRRSWGLCVGFTVPLFVPPFKVTRVRDRPSQCSKINGLREEGARSNRPIRTHNAEVEGSSPSLTTNEIRVLTDHFGNDLYRRSVASNQ